jgi:hypothetical protein
MPIDPRIPLSVFANQPNFTESLAQGMQLRSLARRQKLEDMQIAEAERQQAEQAGIRQAAAGAVTPAQSRQVNIPGVTLGQYGDVGGHTDTLNSPPSFDREKMLSNLAANPNTAADVPNYQAQFAQQDQQMQEMLTKIKSGQLALQGAQIKALNDHADAVGRYAGPVAQMEQEKADPNQINAVYQQQRAAAQQAGLDVSELPAQYVPGLGQRIMGQAMSVKDAVANQHSNATLAETQRHNQQTEQPKPGVDVPFSPEVQKQKIAISLASKAAPLGAGGLDDAAVDQAAQMYLQTGQMPALGMGAAAAGLRTKIMNRAAQLNGTADIAQNKAAFGTYQQQSKNAQPQFIAIRTANQHLDLVGQAAKALDNGNLQMLNNIANQYGVAVGNDPKTTFDAIVTVAGPEVVKASAATGQMAESEIARVRSNFQSGMSPKQIESNVAAMRGLMDGKYKSLQKNLADLKGGNVTGGAGVGETAPVAPQVSNIHVNPQTGQKIGWDGKQWVALP